MLRAATLLRRSAHCWRVFSSAARGPPLPPGLAPPGARAPAAAAPPPRGIIGLDGRVIAPRAPPPLPRPAAGAPAGAAALPAPALEPVIDVTAANFQAAVLRSPVAVILQATAAWCEPCKKLSPRLEQVARAARGALVYARLDVDANPDLAAQLAVRSLPTVWGLVLGKAVDTFQGLPAEDRLRQFLETVISAAETAGAVPGEGGGGGGGNPLEEAARAVAAVGEGLEAGRFGEALTTLRAILTTLQGVEQGFRDAQAAELDKALAAAPPPAPGARPALKRKAINPVPREIQDLGARTLAYLGAWGGGQQRSGGAYAFATAHPGLLYIRLRRPHLRAHTPHPMHPRALSSFPRAVRACCGQSQLECAGGVSTAAAQALVVEAGQHARLLREAYKSAAGMPEVMRALAVEAAAGRSLEALRAAPLEAHQSAASAAPKDAGARLRLGEALLGVGRAEEALEAGLEALRLARGSGGAVVEAARSTVLACFEVLGERHAATLAGRKALTRVLFN